MAMFLLAQGSSLLAANVLDTFSSLSLSPLYLTLVLLLGKSPFTGFLFFKGGSSSPLYITF